MGENIGLFIAFQGYTGHETFGPTSAGFSAGDISA